METWTLLSEVVILLTASLLAGGVFSRSGQSPLVGYILAGMVLGGPGSLGLVRSQHAIESIAELGVSLLLFSIGLEFAWDRVRKLGTTILLAGIPQVLVTSVLAALVAVVAGLSGRESAAVGAMVSLSSTAVVLRILTERAEGDSAHGRNSVGILLLQDAAVVPLAILVATLGGGESLSGVAAGAGRILFLAAWLIIVTWLIIGKVAVFALGTLTCERNRELTALLAVVTGLGSTWALFSLPDDVPSLGIDRF